MKYGTVIFAKVLSGLFQQKLVSAEKRKRFLTEWNNGTIQQDYDKMLNLVKELKALNVNETWRTELEKVMELLTEEKGGTLR